MTIEKGPEEISRFSDVAKITVVNLNLTIIKLLSVLRELCTYLPAVTSTLQYTSVRKNPLTEGEWHCMVIKSKA